MNPRVDRSWRRPLAGRARAALVTVCGVLLAVMPAPRAGASPSGPPAYTATDLGTLGGSTRALGLNNLGQIVGGSRLASGATHAFLWDQGKMVDLGTPGGQNSGAAAINDAGQIAASADTPGGLHAFLYTGGTFRDLGTLPPPAGASDHGLESAATAINAAGHVVGYGSIGYAEFQQGHVWAFFDDGTSMQNLGPLPGMADWVDHPMARGINASDVVVGTVVSEVAYDHGFLWQNGVMHDLTPPGAAGSLANGINDAGQVVGAVDFPVGGVVQIGGGTFRHAYLWDGTGAHDLGVIDGQSSMAQSINNLGQVIGRLDTSSDPKTGADIGHFFLYTGAVMYELNGFILREGQPNMDEVVAINDRGQILANGTVGSVTHAYLLNPTPAPRIGLNPAKLDFGDQPLGTTGAPQSVTITNTGDQPLTISKVAITGANASAFSIANDSGEATLDPGATRTLQLTFTPTAASSNAAALTISDNDELPISAHSVALSGSGGVPVISVSAGLIFGDQVVGGSAAQTIGIGNTGTAPLLIRSVSLAGDDAGDFAAGDLAGASIGPGQSRTISVQFSPTARGSRGATLSIASSAAGSPQTVSLTGTGIGPVARINPASLDFGPQPVGLNTALGVLVQNTGDAPLHLGKLGFEGPNADEFSLATGGSGETLQPGDIALLNIRFSPLATGSRSATLVIPSDAVAQGAPGPQLVPLTGVGTEPLLRLSADSLLFAVQPASGAAATQSLTLTNNGDAPLAIQGLSLSGPDAASFHLVGDTGEPSLNPGQSRTLTISFSPATTAGLRARIATVSYKAALEIQHNDPHPDAPHTVTLFATTDAGPTGISIHPLPPTSLAPTGPPAAPTGLTAHAPSAGEVDLTWTDNSSNEQAFAIWRTGGGQDWARVGIMGPHASSYTDTTVQPGVSYTYKVRAIGGGGASDWSNTVSLTPGAPPAAPTGLAADAAGSGVTLTWSNNSTDEQAFAIWRRGGGNGWARVGIAGPGATTYTDTTVHPGAAYAYQLRAINRFGASGWSNQVSVTTAAAPPAAPTGLAAAVSSGQVMLTWTSQSTDEHAFAIWRTGGGQDWARVGIAGPHATRYTDSGLAPGTSHTYRVRAIGAGGASGWSNEVSVLMPAAP